MTPRETLKQLVLDVFLLDDSEFSWELTREEVDTWDSLGVVSLAVGIDETFGYHCTPDEAMAIRSVPDVIALLKEKGIDLDA